MSHNTFELTLPPGVRFISTTPRLVPFYMAPQGVSDVIVSLEALPQKVLDCFNQLFLDVGQPPHAFDNYEGAPPAMLAYDCVPPFEAVSAEAPQAIADSDADGIVVLKSVDREQVLVDCHGSGVRGWTGELRKLWDGNVLYKTRSKGEATAGDVRVVEEGGG